VRRFPTAVLMVLAAAAETACGAGRAGRGVGGAGPLRGYVLVVPGREAFDTALGAVLRKRGFRVLTSVRGGGKPAAALVRFTFRNASTESGRWLHARFFDTRTGLLVAAASIPLDTLPDDPGLHARLLVAALLAAPPGDH
jgi:hypothetical protein